MFNEDTVAYSLLGNHILYQTGLIIIRYVNMIKTTREETLQALEKHVGLTKLSTQQTIYQFS